MWNVTPQYIDVEVDDNANCWPLHRVFQTLGPSRRISVVMAPDPRGAVAWCKVTGWNENGPCQAYAAPVADSGEGNLTLIYGGEHGVRLKLADTPGPWALDSQSQWGEPCLLLDAEVETH